MKIKLGINEAVWMGMGSLVLLAILAVLAHYRAGESDRSGTGAATARAAVVAG